MNKIIKPPRNTLIATSLTMTDGRKTGKKVSVEDKRSCHTDVFGAAPDVGVPLNDQLPLIIPFYRWLLVLRGQRDE